MTCEFPSKAETRLPVDVLSALTGEHTLFEAADGEERTLLHLAAAVSASVSVLVLTESSLALMHGW
eukprot:1889218-Rhodomonas_salina.1